MSRAKLPFWIHQVVEYGIGACSRTRPIHSPQPVVPLLAGLVVIVLAATADGPAACFHVVSRPVHRVLDIVVAAACSPSASCSATTMGGAGQILLVLGALALGVLTLRSDYRTEGGAARPERRPRRQVDAGSARRTGRATRPRAPVASSGAA